MKQETLAAIILISIIILISWLVAPKENTIEIDYSCYECASPSDGVNFY